MAELKADNQKAHNYWLQGRQQVCFPEILNVSLREHWESRKKKLDVPLESHRCPGTSRYMT